MVIGMEEKTKGQDIKNFVLIKDDYDNYCLGFKLEDGSVESVTAKSYLSCFGKGTQTDDERLHSAMRYEVKYQSEEYKKITNTFKNVLIVLAQEKLVWMLIMLFHIKQ